MAILTYFCPRMDVLDAVEVIGRADAKRVLGEAYRSPRASLVSVVGRRRVGKTFLVKEVYSDVLKFVATGVAGATKQEQLKTFRYALDLAFPSGAAAGPYTDWFDAFADVSQRIAREAYQQRVALFFDELPWLASRRSGFLKAFSWFWNSWAVNQNIVVVVCGSAASWMVQKIVRDRGGLHNRITHRITLYPFSLQETNEFMDSRGVIDDTYQRTQLYMALGGVPFYLDQVRAGESAQQAIERLLFASAAPLANEFRLLYASLFERPENHVQVVRALASRQVGLTRPALMKAAGIASTGTLSRVLEELELSGFVMRTIPFGKRKKDALYRLIDEYSRFYLQFLDGVNPGATRFVRLSTTPAYRAWTGYAFENVALRNVELIAEALGISGIDYLPCSFVAKAKEDLKGIQIDLLLDRADRITTLVEAKFTEEPFELTNAYVATLRERRSLFRQHTGSRKPVSLVLLSAFEVRKAKRGAGIVDRVLDLEALLRG